VDILLIDSIWFEETLHINNPMVRPQVGTSFMAIK